MIHVTLTKDERRLLAQHYHDPEAWMLATATMEQKLNTLAANLTAVLRHVRANPQDHDFDELRGLLRDLGGA